MATLSAPAPGDMDISSIAFSPDGTMLAGGDGDGSTYVWSVASRSLLANPADPGDQQISASYPTRGIIAVAFSPDGTTLAAGDADGSTYLWSVPGWKLLATLTDPGRQGVNAVAFSPAGTMLAVGGTAGSTSLWSPASGNLLAVHASPGGTQIYAVAFSPSGTMLAAGRSDGTTYVWSMVSGKLIATLTDAMGGLGQADAVAFSPKSRTLAVSDHSLGEELLWNLSSLRQH